MTFSPDPPTRPQLRTRERLEEVCLGQSSLSPITDAGDLTQGLAPPTEWDKILTWLEEIYPEGSPIHHVDQTPEAMEILGGIMRLSQKQGKRMMQEWRDGEIHLQEEKEEEDTELVEMEQDLRHLGLDPDQLPWEGREALDTLVEVSECLDWVDPLQKASLYPALMDLTKREDVGRMKEAELLEDLSKSMRPSLSGDPNEDQGVDKGLEELYHLLDRYQEESRVWRVKEEDWSQVNEPILREKIREYQERTRQHMDRRIEAGWHEGMTPHGSEDLQVKLDQRRVELKDYAKELEPYRGLPLDMDEAKDRYKEAKKYLAKVESERDALLGDIARSLQ
ncbi:MAG: hypothetical protein DHS80DRAFT_23911 [Piptocephalis tieghemiana]|nr:MAG: hypothetical protein DHS80DRAFT_23911 [Piptocephalis tieghemiana]